jgi:hypothetical protein
MVVATSGGAAWLSARCGRRWLKCATYWVGTAVRWRRLTIRIRSSSDWDWLGVGRAPARCVAGQAGGVPGR